MINRLYVYNYRCLESIAIEPDQRPSVLLIGRNGSGKSTVLSVLEILQSIGRGTRRVGDLISSDDFSWFRTDSKLRFEIDVMISGRSYAYHLSLELPSGFRELRVAEESLLVNEKTIFTRVTSEVRHLRYNKTSEFGIDWHQVALPIIQDPDPDLIEPLLRWFAGMVLLSPIPQIISGESREGTLYPSKDACNVAAWFRELISQYPQCYIGIIEYLKYLMPDLESIQNRATGVDSKNLEFVFRHGQNAHSQSFHRLSDGEKCLTIAALVVAAARMRTPLFCFWDEPDNFVGLSEVNSFILHLRKAFKQNGGQFFATSHNELAIRSFSKENVLYFSRRSHTEPTVSQWASDLDLHTDLTKAIVRGELDVYSKNG